MGAGFLAAAPRGLLGVIDAADVDQDQHRHHDAGDARSSARRRASSRPSSSAPTTSGATASPTLPPMLWNDITSPLRSGKRLASHGIAVGMPEVVADAEQGRAGEHHPIGVRKAHHEIGKADPEQRHRHQQALAADRVDENPARDVGDRAGRELAGQDRADLAVAQAELGADQRQQQIERRRIPMRQRVADADDPDLLKRAPWAGARSG